jgi:hypothetical protein
MIQLQRQLIALPRERGIDGHDVRKLRDNNGQISS